MRDGTADKHGGFQVHPRMRLLRDMHEITHQMHVVEAIRRNPEIDKGDLYGRARAELAQGDDSGVFADLSEWTKGMASGQLKGQETDAAARVIAGAGRLRYDDAACPNINEFNNRFLNGRGLAALLNILITRDAAKLDLAAIDELRGGEALQAAYGPRHTQRQKRLGVKIQAILKSFPTVDEPAMREAADRYVEYRFLDGGSLPDYERRKGLEGDPRSNRYLRNWFGKFDEALGYPPPPRGRPPKRSSKQRGQR